jgi:murein DD-endopeptidase MepM/ murein hydrolase activator NlpD
MRKDIGCAILSGLLCGGAFSVASVAKEHQGTDTTGLQVHVPFEPTAFTSPHRDYSAYKLARPKADEPLRLQHVDTNDLQQRNSKPGAASIHLSYELLLTNIGSAPLTLTRIEIADASRRNAPPVAAYEGSELEALLAYPDGQQPEADGNRRQLKATERMVVNLFISFQGRKFVPATLRHRVYTTDAVVEAPLVKPRRSQLRVIGPPLRGGDWYVTGGPGATGKTTYHRQNTFILNGKPEAARRYAIDWIKVENGEMQSGSRLADNASYHGYGQEVLAVADGVVTTTLDGMPENVPGRVPPLEPVAPVCILCGNHVVLELARGQFATYMHLQPGSLRVAKGDRVRRGQVLGLVGNSGNSSLPHLHFQLATEPGMTGQGLPYLIERFDIIDRTGASQPRARELPLDGMVIDFGS